MFLNPLFDEIEVHNERNVIISEINEYLDTPSEILFDLFLNNIFRNHPVGMPIIGEAESINRATKNNLVNFYEKYYLPENLIISLAGNFEEDEIFSKLTILNEKTYNNKQINNARSKSVFHPTKNFLIKPIEQVHFSIAFQGVSIQDEKRFPLHLINVILGGCPSSRLYQIIREQKGLCYSITTFNSFYSDNGVFFIYASINPNKFDEILKIIFEEIHKLKDAGISEEELVLAKNYTKGNIIFNQESLSNRMMRNAGNEIHFNKIITYKDVIEKINNVDISKINELIDEIFDLNNYAFYSIGPKKHKKILTKNKIL